MELFFEIFIAAMAVFGVWCALCLIAQSLFSSRNIGVAIEIFEESTADRLIDLLEETKNAPLSHPHAPLVVLYSEDLCLSHARPTAAEAAMIERVGGRWFTVNVRKEDTKKQP